MSNYTQYCMFLYFSVYTYYRFHYTISAALSVLLWQIRRDYFSKKNICKIRFYMYHFKALSNLFFILALIFQMELSVSIISLCCYWLLFLDTRWCLTCYILNRWMRFCRTCGAVWVSICLSCVQWSMLLGKGKRFI